MKQVPPKQISNIGLASLLLISGACALGYQAVWLREFRLVFGATTAATGAVLAIFMGGLGVGNAWFAKRVDRWRNPLCGYAFLELGILITVAISPWLIDLCRLWNLRFGGQEEMGKWGATLFRLASSTAVLIIPTFLMGGTLPCCARIITDEGDLHRRGVGLIYGFNTLGALVGVLVANFFLLEWLGNRGLLWSCCGINAGVAATAWMLAHRRKRFCEASMPEQSTAKTQPLKASRQILDSSLGATSRIGLLLFSASIGFVFFVMELVWYRMLGPLLGGTTYTFALILASVLAGIGLGGAFYAAVAPRLRNLRCWVSVTCAAEATALGIPFWLGDHLAMWVLRQSMESVIDFQTQILHWSLVTAFVVFPTSFIAGFQFPLLIALVGAGRSGIGRDVGWLFSANTMGSIAGSLAGGFLFLPWLTAPRAWQFCLFLLVFASLLWTILGWRATPARRPPRWAFAAMTMLGISSLLTIVSDGPTAFWRHSGIGAKRNTPASKTPNSEQALLNRQRRIPILETEGIETSIAITATDSLTFVVNGKSDGNAFGDCRTQIGSTILGALIHAAPKSGLVIGLGTGESAGWLASIDFMERVDVVELEPEIVRMAELCSLMNEDVLRNPKVRLSFNDAREALLATEERYDLIFSEPSNPYRSGVANLYTDEFYKSISNRLSPGGLFLQWLQGYEVDAQTIHVALHTLRTTFSEIQVWITQSRDILFVCGGTGAFSRFDESQLGERLKVSAISRGLRNSWRTVDVAGVIAHYVCGTRTIDATLEGKSVRLNTDDRNVLEFAFAKSLGTFTEFSIEDLRGRALEYDDQSPLVKQEISSNKIKRRIISSYVVPGSYVPEIPGLAAEERRQSDAMNYYLAGNYEQAACRLAITDVDVECPIERVVAAHTYAVTRRPIPPEWLEHIEEFRLSEALAIRSTVQCKQEDWEACLRSLRELFIAMRTDPWGMSQVLRQAYENALVVAKVDEKFAAEIDEMLAERWAVYRDEEKRRHLRYRVALVGPEENLLRAIGDFEPHPVWTQAFLEKRAELYQRNRHALRGQAERDLAKYRIQYEIGDP